MRRSDVIGHTNRVINADLPGELSQYKARPRSHRLKVTIFRAQIFDRFSIFLRKRRDGRRVVPVSVVLSEVAETLIRTEKHVFSPAESDIIGMGGSPLKSDHFIDRSPPL